jgi:hypothetical protein
MDKRKVFELLRFSVPCIIMSSHMLNVIDIDCAVRVASQRENDY